MIIQMLTLVYLFNSDALEIIQDRWPYAINTVRRVKRIFKNFRDHASVSIRVSSDDEIGDIYARVIKPDSSIIIFKERRFRYINFKNWRRAS